MNGDTILGIIIAGTCIGFLSYIMYRSAKTIKMISEKKLTSLRDIVSELKNGG